MGLNAPRSSSEDNTPHPLTEEDIAYLYPREDDQVTGVPDAIRQGERLGNCYFVIALNELRGKPIFERFLRERIRKRLDDQGRPEWTVHFWGSQEPIIVTEEDISRGKFAIRDKKSQRRSGKEKKKIISQVQSHSPIDRVLEVAFGRHLKQNHRRKRSYETHDNCTYAVQEGGFSHHFLQVFLGTYYDYGHRYPMVQGGQEAAEGLTMMYGESDEPLSTASEESKQTILRCLRDYLENPDAFILNAATPSEGRYTAKGKLHQRVREGAAEMKVTTYADPKGRFVSRHAYAIEPIPNQAFLQAMKDGDFRNAGKLLRLTIINPWDTSKPETISFADFLEYFRQFRPVHILQNQSRRRNPNTPKERVAEKSSKLQLSLALEKGSKVTIRKEHLPVEIGAKGSGIYIQEHQDGWEIINQSSGMTTGSHAWRTATPLLFGSQIFSQEACRLDPQTSGALQFVLYPEQQELRVESISNEPGSYLETLDHIPQTQLINREMRRQIEAVFALPRAALSETLAQSSPDHPPREIREIDCPIELSCHGSRFTIKRHQGHWEVYRDEQKEPETIVKADTVLRVGRSSQMDIGEINNRHFSRHHFDLHFFSNRLYVDVKSQYGLQLRSLPRQEEVGGAVREYIDELYAEHLKQPGRDIRNAVKNPIPYTLRELSAAGYHRKGANFAILMSRFPCYIRTSDGFLFEFDGSLNLSSDSLPYFDTLKEFSGNLEQAFSRDAVRIPFQSHELVFPDHWDILKEYKSAPHPTHHYLKVQFLDGGIFLVRKDTDGNYAFALLDNSAAIPY